VRKSLWMLSVLLLSAALLGSTAVRADTIVASGGNVTAINGIIIAGTTYNLTFVTTAGTPYVGDPTGVAGVESQLIADLTGNATAGGGFGVILDNAPSGEHAVVNFGGGWASDDQSFNFFCTPGPNCGAVWADFTPVAATPEPGTSVLTLPGLGLLGVLVVMRKRIA
jgi:hypothetical protein